jgi:hypothetical protein
MPSTSIGKNIVFTSGETIVTKPDIKNKEDSKKIKILKMIIILQA